MTDRQELAYNVFRGGCSKASKPPAWTDLEPWMRDAMLTAYLQGKLDGSTNYRAAVHCVRCVDGAGHGPVHIFSTQEKAAAFAKEDPRDHVLYDYVIDVPERMEQVAQ